jgi:endonuclease/exonuclease/phosphatase family metal-dependent hydrolase
VTTLTFLTLNTGNEFTQPTALSALLTDVDVSVAALQELHADTAGLLRQEVQDQFPHQILSPAYIHGKGLISRFPIVRHDWFVLPSGRTCLEAVLDIAGTPARVFVVHLTPPERGRMVRPTNQDVEVLISRATWDTPSILAGDFNFVRPARSYRLLRQAGFSDAFASAGSGSGLTYPTRYQHRPITLPRMVRIDYIWMSEHFVARTSWVGPEVGSDHKPLLAELELRVDRQMVPPADA